LISPDYVFSQNSLQDFLECPRRFQLRYLLHTAWPTAETDDQSAFEHHQEQGQVFHRKIQQYYTGIPVEIISASIQDDLLQSWWDNFLNSARDFPWAKQVDHTPGFTLHPEYSLSARIHDHHLVAKYDLIAALPGKQFWIYDWKTSLSIPPREKLEQRIQTRLYSWMLVNAGSHLNGGRPISPDQVLMTYWFAHQPGQQLLFPYSQEQYKIDTRDLGELLDHISALADSDFTLTEDTRRCRFCTYRSYCERGFAPGKWSEIEEDATSMEIPSWDGDDIQSNTDSNPLEL
jgi:hypothetical protein